MKTNKDLDKVLEELELRIETCKNDMIALQPDDKIGTFYSGEITAYHNILSWIKMVFYENQ